MSIRSDSSISLGDALEKQAWIGNLVRIKGFMVDLDGVSEAIEKVPGVHRACAILNKSILWGFYSGPSAISETSIEFVVKKYQPLFAVPTKWIYLPNIPITSMGKVNQKILLSLISTPIPTGAGRKNDPAVIQPLKKCLVRNNGTVESFSTSASTAVSKCSSNCSTYTEELRLPEKNGTHRLRAFHYKIFNLYRRLFSIVFLSNLGGLIAILLYSQKLENLAIAVAANITASLLIRNEHVVNLLFKIACSVPTSAPLFIRRNCAKIYHIGGLHSGFAVASTVWLVAFTVLATIQRSRISLAILGITYALDLLLVTILALAYPAFRAKFHDQFEITHRFAGWTSLILFWCQTILLTNSLNIRSSNPKPLGIAILYSPGIWLLVVSTISIALPWLRLRKVKVYSEVLSKHAIRLYFNYANPVPGSAIRISSRPLVEWHAFATIAHPSNSVHASLPTNPTFSVVISNAGDWTSHTIANPPSKIYIRGVPTCGVLRIIPLFKSLIVVATGSGIGPFLPHIYARKVPMRIVWSTPNPKETFGYEILDAIMHADPNALIWDTKKSGRPDLVAISWEMWKESGAEAVCVISNKKVTQKVVYGLETRNVPAFGAIFDS